MNLQIENNIRIIYTNKRVQPPITQHTLDQFIAHLYRFWNTHQGVLGAITTPLKNGKPHHFTFLHDSRMKPCLFAGAVETANDGHAYPIIRLDQQNQSLSLINEQFLFRYYKRRQKSNTVDVRIADETINSIPDLLTSQLTWFTHEYPNKKIF